MPQLEISRTESGKVSISKKKDSIIILSQKNSQQNKNVKPEEVVVSIEDQNK